MPVSDVVGTGFRRRMAALLSLGAVTPAGFLFKFYGGPGQWWFNDYGAGVLYEIFWCLVLFLFWPADKNTTKIAIGVFVVTCVLEALQLWHPAFLQQVRATFPGGALIGTTFVWWDFPHYALGSFLGWLWMSGIIKLKACQV